MLPPLYTLWYTVVYTLWYTVVYTLWYTLVGISRTPWWVSPVHPGGYARIPLWWVCPYTSLVGIVGYSSWYTSLVGIVGYPSWYASLVG